MNSEGVTIHTATAVEAISIRRFERENPGQGRGLIGQLLAEADMMCGGKCTEDELVMLGRMVWGNFNHRSVESLVLAIKEGIGRTDKDGKVYEKLTWPKVHLWLMDHEEKILSLSQDAHARAVVKGDNYGADWMEREQHAAEAKDRAIASKDRLIEQLKRKLDAKPKAQ